MRREEASYDTIGVLGGYFVLDLKIKTVTNVTNIFYATELLYALKKVIEGCDHEYAS